ncbi:MAG: BolA family protein [Alphaproteobacteria bacterium]|nr:BolA family protein [Alphaproteobacteria bacterium]MDI9329834.1 BolA family protein [Alphaproteobacteria bacterium]
MDARQLQDIISAALPCEHIEVNGDGRHWYATLVSPAFQGLSRVRRHQLVYSTLGQRMHTDEVHALSMKTLTPAEWAEQGSNHG